MADILVRFNQAESDVQSWANLKARHLGFSEEALGFWFKQDNDTDFGEPVLIPSTIGQGMGRRVTQAAHGFTTKTLIRFNGSVWVKALATTDTSTLATHMVVRVLDTDRFELSAMGAWSLGGAPAGPYYLSEATAGALSSTAPVAGISQRVAVGDGTAYHLTLSGSPVTAVSGDFRAPVLSIVKAPPSTPAAGDRHLIYKEPTTGTAFEGHGKHIATYTGSTWSFEIPSTGWAVMNKATGVPYFYTISGNWKPMYSGAGFTSFNDPSAYVSGELIVWDGADAFDPESPGGRPPTGRAIPSGRIYGTAPATIPGLKGYCGVGGRAAYDDSWAVFGFAPGGESIESNHGIMTFFAGDDGPGAQSQGFLFASGNGPSIWNDLFYMEDGWGYQFHQLPSVGLLGTDANGKLIDASGSIAGSYQPLDSDLTAIAALSTTTFGRALLTLADAATGRAALGALAATLKGAANGVAELDASGKVPAAQLPSYVDDVLEFANLAAFPATGETGKIYVAQATNLTYRWSGSAYVGISASLALGETSSTAYRGDRGAAAYTHSQVTGANPHATPYAQLVSIPAALDAIDGLTPAADRLPYYTGAATAALATITAFARTLLDDADAATARATLGAQAAGSYQPLDSDLTAIAALTTTTFGRALLTLADAAAGRTALGALSASLKGAVNGVAELDSSGKVPVTQIPALSGLHANLTDIATSGHPMSTITGFASAEQGGLGRSVDTAAGPLRGRYDNASGVSSYVDPRSAVLDAESTTVLLNYAAEGVPYRIANAGTVYRLTGSAHNGFEWVVFAGGEPCTIDTAASPAYLNGVAKSGTFQAVGEIHLVYSLNTWHITAPTVVDSPAVPAAWYENHYSASGSPSGSGATSLMQYPESSYGSLSLNLGAVFRQGKTVRVRQTGTFTGVAGPHNTGYRTNLSGVGITALTGTITWDNATGCRWEVESEIYGSFATQVKTDIQYVTIITRYTVVTAAGVRYDAYAHASGSAIDTTQDVFSTVSFECIEGSANLPSQVTVDLTTVWMDNNTNMPAAPTLAQSIGSDGDLIYRHPTGQKLFNGNFLYSWTYQGGGDYSNLTVESTTETTIIDQTTQGRNGIVPVIAAGYLLSKGPIWVLVRGGYGVVGANPVLTVRVYLGTTVVGIKRIDLSTFTHTTENMGMSLLFWIEPIDLLTPGTSLRLRTHHYGQASKGLADSAGSFLLSEDETYANIDATVAQNLKVTAQWSALGSQTWAFFDGIAVYR